MFSQLRFELAKLELPRCSTDAKSQKWVTDGSSSSEQSGSDPVALDAVPWSHGARLDLLGPLDHWWKEGWSRCWTSLFYSESWLLCFLWPWKPAACIGFHGVQRGSGGPRSKRLAIWGNLWLGNRLRFLRNAARFWIGITFAATVRRNSGPLLNWYNGTACGRQKKRSIYTWENTFTICLSGPFKLSLANKPNLRQLDVSTRPSRITAGRKTGEGRSHPARGPPLVRRVTYADMLTGLQPSLFSLMALVTRSFITSGPAFPINPAAQHQRQ